METEGSPRSPLSRRDAGNRTGASDAIRREVHRHGRLPAFILDRADVGLLGALAGGETEAQKQGGEGEKTSHTAESEVGWVGVRVRGGAFRNARVRPPGAARSGHRENTAETCCVQRLRRPCGSFSCLLRAGRRNRFSQIGRPPACTFSQTVTITQYSAPPLYFTGGRRQIDGWNFSRPSMVFFYVPQLA